MMTMDFLHRRRSMGLTQLGRDSASPTSAAHDKPLPNLPNVGPIENIPRSRSGPSTAGELIRRVSSIFSSRKKRPSTLQFAHANISNIYESHNSSMHSLVNSEEDDIRRPSGLGSAVSISSNRSLPPSPFSPSYPQHPRHSDPTSSDSHSPPFGHMRARATSTPNILRSLSLRSKGSNKKKNRPPPGNSSSHTGSQAHLSTTATSNAHSLATISCIPVETIAIIFSHLPKSDVAQIGRTCRLFLHASRTVLYTHFDLGELGARQLERFVALLATRRDFTDLVRSFACETWPRFFLTTASSAAISPSYSAVSPSSASTYTSILTDPNGNHDPDTQHRNSLLTATFTLAFQRMSNLTSLILPAYDHDLLAHHTAFGLRSITFMCSSLSREEANELFAWLDGQTNITTLLFPNLSQDCDYGLPQETPTNRTRSPSPARPATSNGVVSQGQSQGKKYLVAPFLVPLPSASSPNPSPKSPAPRTPSPKLSPRPKTAAPSSPSYATTTFPASVSSSGSHESARSYLPPPNSQIPFPTSGSSTSINKLPQATATTTPYNHTPIIPHVVNVNTHIPARTQYQTSPLTSPTLLPNLTTLQGPPSLIIALSSPPSASSPLDTYASRPRTRPLKTVTLNISSTLYSGLRPAAIVNRLVGVTRSLGLKFGESVDRRTVEKVLGAAGSALGGNACGLDVQKERGKEKEDEREFGKGYRFGEGEWQGLVQLDVSFVAGGPGSDEALHKMINSAIPRYPYLRVLRLSYTQSTTQSSSNLLAASPTIPPLVTTPGASPTNPSLPLTPTPGVFTDITASAKTNGSGPVKKVLSPPEQAYIRQWTKHCPDLERVVFLSGAEWRK